MLRSFSILFLGICLSVLSCCVYAERCLDPNQSLLREGGVPEPWQVNPFSEHEPQGEDGARFIRATIMVIGRIGRGIICTYQNSNGYYSIWWPTVVRIPSSFEYAWHDSLGGFECTSSLEACEFWV